MVRISTWMYNGKNPEMILTLENIADKNMSKKGIFTGEWLKKRGVDSF